jgi:thioredoxin-like negative regulator of GroEL
LLVFGVSALGLVAFALWGPRQLSGRQQAHQHFAEAQALFATGRAADAENRLKQALQLDPAATPAWLLYLDLLRIEERTWEAWNEGWRAYAAVPAVDRPAILRSITLALLAAPDDQQARATLARWFQTDPADRHAEVAWLHRVGQAPRGDAPPRAERIARLEALHEADPDERATRAALIQALADAGSYDRGRALLDAWPEPERDLRYDQLVGRFALEYDKDPARAIAALERVVAVWPHDWRSWYRLARAHTMRGETEKAARAAARVSTLRELLDARTLGQRLEAALGHLEDPAARGDLIALCESVGLDRLAQAWRQVQPDQSTFRLGFPARTIP